MFKIASIFASKGQTHLQLGDLGNYTPHVLSGTLKTWLILSSIACICVNRSTKDLLQIL